MIDPTTPQKFALVAVTLLITAAVGWFYWKVIGREAYEENLKIQKSQQSSKKPQIKTKTAMKGKAIRKINATSKSTPKKTKSKKRR